MLKYKWYGYSVFVPKKIKLQWLLKTLWVMEKTNKQEILEGKARGAIANHHSFMCSNGWYSVN